MERTIKANSNKRKVADCIKVQKRPTKQKSQSRILCGDVLERKDVGT